MADIKLFFSIGSLALLKTIALILFINLKSKFYRLRLLFTVKINLENVIQQMC